MLSVYCPGIKVREQALIDLLLYMIAGVFVGLTSGLFGLGGGVVMVPAMLPIFAAQGMSVDVAMHVAVASSLATIVFTGISSAHAHWRLGNVVFSILPWLVLGLVLGALTGAQIAAALSGQALRFIFGFFFACVLIAAVSRWPTGLGKRNAGDPGRCDGRFCDRLLV